MFDETPLLDESGHLYVEKGLNLVPEFVRGGAYAVIAQIDVWPKTYDHVV